jgi:hypothetical protein
LFQSTARTQFVSTHNALVDLIREVRRTKLKTIGEAVGRGLTTPLGAVAENRAAADRSWLIAG